MIQPIVWDKILRKNQSIISNKIQKIYPNVEQVMFAERIFNGRIRGQMAGGEFCGNATRSLGYLLLKGKDGKIDIEVSGSDSLAKVSVVDDMSKTSIPIKKDLNSVQLMPDNADNYIVHMDGISFIIASSKNHLGKTINNQKSEIDRKKLVKNVLDQINFSKKYPASGIMVADKISENNYNLDPYVYVRNTGSLYYETGCGSGSTAVGLMIAKESSKSIKSLKVTQPSGMNLYVSIDRDINGFKSASVNGPVDIVYEGNMSLENHEI